MKWLVGYQLMESDRFMQEILQQKDQIQEVYFSWGDMPNGRHTGDVHRHLTAWEARRCMEADLEVLSRAGLSFNLLLNGGCYGERSLARSFFTEVCEAVDEVSGRFGLCSVTTTSPVLAHLIKENFPRLEVRASVNMEIGTVEAMEYLGGDFDSFYIRREWNRNLPALRELSAWCREHGKKCFLLANSGCLNFCPSRQFHDNLVAHERGIMQMDNAVVFHGICRDYLRREKDRSVLLRRLSFIRPEDTGLYEEVTSAMKLATRVNPAPERILRAYAQGTYAGNLLDLLEPDYAGELYPLMIENGKLPADFGERVAGCGQVCGRAPCTYCRDAFEGAAVFLEE